MERQNQPLTFDPSVKGGKHLDVCDVQEPFGGSSSSNTDGCATSSTMWDQRHEDSAAFSSDQSWTDEDDDEVPGPSHGSDRFTDINTQLDFKDKLPLPEFDSCEEVSGSFVPQEDKAPLSSDDDDGTEEVYAPSGGSDEEYTPSGGSDEEYVPSGGSDEEYVPSSGSEGEDKPRRGSKKEHVPSHDSAEEDVPSGDERISAQPSYTKKNYCYVCGKGVIKFARHLVRHVKKDPEAAEVLALPKCSKERKHALERLRNRGNYNHNQEVLRNKSGELKLKMRRRAMSVSAKTVVHCLYCKGLFNRKNMWNHVYRCTYRKMLNSDTQDKSDALRKLTPLETRFSRELPSGMWNLLSTMKHDEVSLTVQNDFSMLQLTQHLMEKHGSDEQKHEYIRQKLRQMGRVLVALQDKSIMNFEDALTPRNFHKVVETVKNMADADEKKQDDVLKIGRSLEKLCRIVLRGKTDREQQRDVRTFLRLCRNKWSELVSQSEGSGKRPSTVTFMHDLQTFYRYLEKKSSSASGDLKTQEDTQVYGSLCRVTLTQVFVLNKGEAMVSKMTLKSFKERDTAAQTLSKHFIGINIKRKAGQSVAVLLTTHLVRALKLLIKKRRKCGVHEDNPFVFAKPDFSATSFYNGENCLTVFSNLCRAKYPQDLRSVHHQEHRARVFQILNLENNELHDLAKLLGHNIRADRDHYRSPEAAVELAKISKLLLAMEKGSLERYRGKSLDEIEIKDELEPDVEQDGAKKGGAEDDNKESEEDSASHQQDGEEEQRHKRLSPVEDALEHIRSESDKHFLQEKFISSSKGRGVFTREPIEKSSFVVEYRGEMSALKESRRKKSDCLNDYLFDFSWDGTNWRVDATEEDGSLGRLVNDDHRNPNCVMRKVDCEGRPHLCLFARRNIYEGEEITYNYGDSSYDWRSNIFCDDRRSSFTRITRQKAPTSPKSTSSKWPQHNDSDDDDVEDEDEADSSLDEASDKEHTICPKNRNYCYVCGKGYAKISRHLFTHRYEEAEIAQVFAMRRTSKERKKLLHKLRNRGNYKHNQEVLKTQCGELKLSRRLPNVSVTSKSFAACIYCKGMYGRKDMWRHMKVCTLKKVSTPPSCRNKILTFVADSGLADSQELPAEVNKVLKKLKKDEVRSAVMSDSYIMHLAHCLCLMTTKNESADFINQNLRLVGRLLINLREKSINSMEEAFKPENFSKLVEGVREIAGFNKETKTCSKPSLILRLGNLIKKMSNIRYGKTLKDDASKETVKDAETFVKLCAEEWTKGSSAQAKINKPPTVLFTRDVQIFYKCMEKTMASAVKSLTLYESPQVYTALLRVTIALVSLFNRRAFEVSKITLQAFKEREAVELPADAAATAAAGPQSQFEQILSKRNMRFNIMGKIKRNVEKKVVLTLTPELLTATELLVSKRKTCGVHDRNPFLFARPVAIVTSFYREQTCIAMFASRCKAKSEESLRSVFFRKHIARIFQILDLTNEQLDELAKVLGRDIQTDREHYRTPEAGGDIAKISELLAAMEDGSLENFEGKSFEEIEIPDEVEPDVEQDNPEDPEEPEAVEEEAEDAEGSVKLSEALLLLPERKKRGQRKKKNKSESEELEPEPEPEPNDKKSDTEKSENKTPEETLSCNFSDNEDMGFDMDVFDDDEDDVRNVENDGENDSNGSGATAERTEVKETTEQEEEQEEEEEEEDDIGDGGEQDNDSDCEDDVAMDDDDGEKHEEEKDEERGEEQTDRMEVESSVSSDTVDTEKKNRLLAIMRGMKEVKIIVRKLDMNLQPPIHITRLPSVFNKKPGRDRQRQTSSSPTDVPDKGVHMFCSNCKKSMMKGHTAFQKKGFTDVFCSKNCLFEKFPINKPNTKTCHYCHKVITQLLDLIMAVVDTKGTMKDFCNLTCVTYFKTNSSPTQTPPPPTPITPPPPPLCSVCNKSCTTTVELTLQDVVHKFCSDSCLEVYCRDNMPACDNCSSFCRKQPLTLKLEEETKTICSQKCLEEFKENVQTHHKCTMCHTTRPLSDMVDYKSSEGSVELFCTRTCVTSYKLQPAIIYKLQGAKGSPRSKKRKMENSNSEDDHVAADSSVNENEASKAAESDITPTLIIAKSWVVCSSCGKRPPKGQMLYQPKSSLEVFCSASCLSERHPHIKVVDKTCYNCCQVIQRPHNIILAPVDDSGTMKELCSETCLSSVQSKRNMAAPKLPPLPGPRSECRMCARFLYCKFKLTLDGVLHKLCNEACFVRYHKVNDMPVPTCYACSSICADRRFMLPTDNGRKTICSEECLVKSKEKVQTLQLCPTCQTSHQLSDMVENRREDGGLDFFCSNRCMMVHRAQTCTVTESKNPSPEDANIKDVKDVIDMKEALDVKDIKDMKDVTDVKPSLPSLSRIKEEPIDEEYNQSLSPSVSTAGIKAETDVAKEDLKIGSVFSLMTDSAPAPATAPPLASTATPVATQVDLRASCSGCKKVLMDGETVYQRKGRTDIFCSTSCLLKFYQMKPGKRTCHFCLQVMTQTQDVLQGDTDGKVMEFCSQTCLSSFNYKKIMSTKIPIVPMSSHSQCSMCSRYCISKHEAVQHGVVHKLCSDTCFLRFSNLNKLSMCENCGSRCDSPLVLRLEDGSKKLCRTECLAQFKTKVQTPQPCSMCRCSTPVSDMVENRTSEDVVELFCSSSCVMASKIAAVSAAGTPVDCDNCERTTVPACHLAMSDASIRNFCSLSCAMAFKERQKDSTAPRDSSAASEQTQSDFLKAPNKLPCAQCRRNIMTTPSVVQKKNKTYFMCSPSCSQEFKKANNIMGRCEYCKNERIIRDVKRVDDRDCNFCSDGCLMLFRHELEKEWGKHCGSCSLCHCISRTLVTSKYDGKEEEFCSEGCNKIFNLLYCHLAKCDTCGRQGELRQSLHMLGEVKHFSDLKCLLHYCQKKLQMVDAVPSPLKPSGTAESSPVIANVISLASALARQDSASSSSSQPASTPDIQTKVIGHVSVQTVPKEVKNKSMLCTPLVHNKGVSCATQMVDTEAQTETFVPKVVVLPLPVPVYVPLPMNMYSQFTPKPVGLPVPLPVPVILPVASEPERSEGKLNDMSEKKTSQDEEKEREDNLEAGEETKEVGGEAQVLKDDTSSCREDVAEEDRGGSRRQEDSTGPPHSPAPPPPPPAPALSQQTQGKAQNKGLKSSQHVEPSNHHKVLSHCGTEAWRRWTQWRESRADLDPGSSLAVQLKDDLLLCPAAVLSVGLSRFVHEVKRPDGEPYSPDDLFYLLLSIQQFLFENGRMENIFSDVIYNTFSTEFTKILKTSVTTRGYIHSRVEEDFLWDCKQLGAYSPIVLLNTLLFFCCKYFGFTTVEQHRQLSFAHVTRRARSKPDNTKTTFLRFCPPNSSTEPEPGSSEDTDGVPAKRRRKHQDKGNVLQMLENMENPLRCPVRLYKFYLSKCPESVRQRADLFYLQPKHRCTPSSPLWFSFTPLDDATMDATLTRILAVRELQVKEAR